jgi:hypothetical protein
MGGQAKRRGTFEERKAQAIARNRVIEDALPYMGNHAKAIKAKHGTQRLATRLAAAGVFAAALSMQKKGV